MNQFILFFRGGKSPNKNQSENKELWASWINKMKQQNRLVAGAPLTDDGLIVNENGKTNIFQFNQMENASGFVIVLANNLDEATILSKGCPIFTDGGNITIRPIIESY